MGLVCYRNSRNMAFHTIFFAHLITGISDPEIVGYSGKNT